MNGLVRIAKPTKKLLTQFSMPDPIVFATLPHPIKSLTSLYALDIDTSLLLSTSPFHKVLYTFLKIVEEQL